MKRGAAQQGDEPVEALELKAPQGGGCVIDVRFAGYRQCYAHRSLIRSQNESGLSTVSGCDSTSR
jgi:hypothetical protein